MFENRKTAGRLLGAELRRYAGTSALVVALPRGGVPVADEVAQMLALPLDIWIVRKLGVPYHRELAMGAIAEGGALVVNSALIRELGIDPALVSEVIRRETEEVKRRVEAYRGQDSPPAIAGRTVIVVDDGVATGATARAALRDLRALGASWLVLAAPVGAPDAIADLRPDVDEVVCLEQPQAFGAVGAWYTDFRQVTDQDVTDILAQRRRPTAA